MFNENESFAIALSPEGKKLAEGNPEQVRANPLVQTAYFGEELT